MSKVVGKQVTIVPTELGGMTVEAKYVVEYDVEDVVRAKAESQARLIQMANVGRDIRKKTLNSKVLPSAFTSVVEDL